MTRALAWPDPLRRPIQLEDSMLQSAEKVGADHPDTLKLRAQLAFSRAQHGAANDAVEILEAVFDRQVDRLGPEDKDALATMNLLAHSRGQAGDLSGAVVDFNNLALE